MYTMILLMAVMQQMPVGEGDLERAGYAILVGKLMLSAESRGSD